jgi:RNA polymerase sigma-70 factor (ECF subfamily)
VVIAGSSRLRQDDDASMSHPTSDCAHPQGFATTRWSLVLAAGRGDAPEAQAALAALCEVYWYPLYAYVRRSGHPADEARDLTQEFFARLLEKHYLRAADSERGRFRSFLLTAFKRFLAKERHRARALKRGGGRRMLSLDFEQGESRFRLEPATDITAETIYERRWALTLLDRVMDRLRDDFERAGKRDDFDRLKVFLTGEAAAPNYREAAAELGTTEGAVKVAVHRLRRRFRDVVLAEIAQTVTAPEDVDEELRYLFEAIRPRPS